MNRVTCRVAAWVALLILAPLIPASPLIAETVPVTTPVETPLATPVPTPAPTATPRLVLPQTPRARVISGLKGDVMGGGWIAATLLSGAANTIVRSLRGEAPDDAVHHALNDLTKPEFLVGSLLGGSVGGALGAALPVPALRGMPFFVRTAGSAAAPLALAAVASTLAANAVALNRKHMLSWGNLFKSVDWTNLTAQTVGSLLGMSLGATLVSMGLAPALALGSVAIVPLVGGIAGAVVAAQIVNWLRTRKIKAEKSASTTGINPTSGNEVIPGNKGVPSEGIATATAMESEHDVQTADAAAPPATVEAPGVLPIDPFADLPVRGR